MAKIKNIRDMRDHALQTLDDLADGKIDIKGAAAHAALYSGVISTIKSEMDYYKMLDKKPQIAFLEGSPVYGGTSSKAQYLEDNSEDE